MRGAAPAAVVTDIGLLAPAADGELVLVDLHPGRTIDEARANTGWPLRVADDLRTTEPPSTDELRLLREELDPDGIYLKGSGG